jgi:hypothetical protein
MADGVISVAIASKKMHAEVQETNAPPSGHHRLRCDVARFRNPVEETAA